MGGFKNISLVSAFKLQKYSLNTFYQEPEMIII